MSESAGGAHAHQQPISNDADTEVLTAKVDEILRVLRRMDTRLEQVSKRTFFMPRELLTDMQAMTQLFNRFTPRSTLPPVAGWALSPSALIALTDLVESVEAQTVVECGSGTSTIWIAYALQRLGRGKVVALDHLPDYAERTQALIDAHGLGWFAEVRLAPLVDRETPRGVFRWYDVDEQTLPAPIDLLLVDGPPQASGVHARYPAMPLLAPRLSQRALILCDDTDRRDEQEMIQFWIAENSKLRPVSGFGSHFRVLELSDD